MTQITRHEVCKRCGGNLFLEREGSEVNLYCLQCSAVYFRKTMPDIPPIKPRKIFAR